MYSFTILFYIKCFVKNFCVLEVKKFIDDRSFDFLLSWNYFNLLIVWLFYTRTNTLVNVLALDSSHRLDKVNARPIFFYYLPFNASAKQFSRKVYQNILFSILFLIAFQEYFNASFLSFLITSVSARRLSSWNNTNAFL